MNDNMKTYCYNCDKDTNHEVLFKETKIGPQEIVGRNEEGDESESVWEVVGFNWTIQKCLGCEEMNFKHVIRSEPSGEHDKIFHFPKKAIRKYPYWIIKLPMQHFLLMQEIYTAVNEGLFVLALNGTRTLLDTFIVSKIGDAGTFKQKLEKLVSEKIISASKVKVLEAAIEAGNASAHRGYRPDKETLFQILDIVDNLMQSEIVDRTATSIKEKTPHRNTKK